MRSPAIYGWRLLYLGLAIVMLWLFVQVGIGLWADSACLSHGYPTASISAAGKPYCVRRVLQTDYVVPLSELDSARKAGGR